MSKNTTIHSFIVTRPMPDRCGVIHLPGSSFDGLDEGAWSAAWGRRSPENFVSICQQNLMWMLESCVAVARWRGDEVEILWAEVARVVGSQDHPLLKIALDRGPMGEALVPTITYAERRIGGSVLECMVLYPEKTSESLSHVPTCAGPDAAWDAL